jgi:PAS domain S-box-containing protein
LGDNPQHRRSGTEVPTLSDDDLSVFLDLSSELFGVFEPQGGLVWCNPSVAAVLGYAPEEIRQVDLAKLVHPEDLGAPTEDVEDFPRDGSSLTLEVRCRTKGDEWRWLEWSGSWEASSGLLYGAARDVTDRRVAHAALVQNEQLMQAILDHSDAVIHVEDLRARYVLVNEAFLHLVGRPRHEVVGRRAAEVWAPRPSPGPDLEAVIGADGSLTTDDEIVLSDGPHTFMTVRFPVRDGEGTAVGVATISTDITGRSRVEQRLSERQRLLDTIVEACPDIVTILDRHGRVEEVSRASARILGYDLEHATHDELEALVHPDDIPAVYDAYGDLMTARSAGLDLRYRVRHADGHWVTLDTRGQAIVSESGDIEGAVVVSRDVTADLAFEAELERALADAERASSAKSEFLSRMSHELRTPLNSVLGFAQLLDMDDLDDTQREAVGHILRAGQHLLNLIDEVLDIARIESGRLDISVEPVPVGAVVGDAVDLTGPLAEDRGIHLAVDLQRCPADAHVRADRQRLLQVLLNLLSNGVKYNRPQGTVSVTVVRHKDMTRISVADTGPGIAPEDAERVFKPFDRLGAERSGVQGTGVGLTLSKHLVEQMGGTIELESEPDAGATFVVSLPTASPPRQVKALAPPPRTGGVPDGLLKVLHIEDNLANLELVEQVLARTGSVELRAAMYGSLGLELAREQRPDLVLLDLHLPDMTGAQVLEQLRAEPETAQVPVVVVSADATPNQVRTLQAGGVLAYLTKPIDVHELLRVVELVSTRSSSDGA